MHHFKVIFSAFVFVQGCVKNVITFEILDIIFLSNSSLEREGAALCDQLSNSFYENCAMRLILSWRVIMLSIL